MGVPAEVGLAEGLDEAVAVSHGAQLAIEEQPAPGVSGARRQRQSVHRPEAGGVAHARQDVGPALGFGPAHDLGAQVVGLGRPHGGVEEGVEVRAAAAAAGEGQGAQPEVVGGAAGPHDQVRHSALAAVVVEVDAEVVAAQALARVPPARAATRGTGDAAERVGSRDRGAQEVRGEGGPARGQRRRMPAVRSEQRGYGVPPEQVQDCSEEVEVRELAAHEVEQPILGEHLSPPCPKASSGRETTRRG